MTNYLEPTEKLCRLSATELANLIRTGEVSAREVTEAHIRRIEEVDTELNAVVIPLFDEARAQADEADKKRSHGERLGALHGVPMTIKEQFRVAGTETTLGYKSLVGNKYDSEGPLLKKLREAGAIIMGKTNILQALTGWECDNPVYGRTNNPWDLDRSPGGSSGGESAIIAAGGVPLGLAGDLGGSTRVPAHFCGLHSLKPTSGRLSNDDFPPDLANHGQESIIAQPGPIARTVDDVKLAMEILAAPEPKETSDMIAPVPWPDPSKVDVAKLRIGFYTETNFFAVSPAIRRAVEEGACALENLGATVQEFIPPDISEAIRLFLAIQSAGGGDGFKYLLGDDEPIPQIAGTIQGLSIPNEIRPEISKQMLESGQAQTAFIISSVGTRTAGEYWALVTELKQYRAKFYAALDQGGFDALLCPPLALPAFTHGSSEHLFSAVSYAAMYNTLGNPAGIVSTTRVKPGEESDRPMSEDMADITAKKVEQGSAGLPVGVQVVGRHWREDIVLAVMAALENQFSRQPSYPMKTFIVR